MSKLKPKLIITDSGRRSRGSGGFWSFLSFLIIFGVGVYIGTKLDDFGIINGGGDQAKQAVTGEKPKDYSEKKEEALKGNVKVYPAQDGIATKEPAVIISEKLESGLSNNSSNIDDPDDGGDSGLTSLDPEGITGRIGDGEEGAEETFSDPGSDPAETDTDKKTQTQGSGGSYTLQIAAFARSEDAREAVKHYKDKGYNAYTVQVENSKGEKWNLVKIGKFSSIEQAWSQSAVFKRREGKEAYVETLSQSTAVNESWEKAKNQGQPATTPDTP
ncbi:MAG: SPOR domain-containing protein [Deltaproteobacteria bacterium]